MKHAQQNLHSELPVKSDGTSLQLATKVFRIQPRGTIQKIPI